MEYLWDIQYMGYVWDIYGICMGYRIFEEYLWDMYEICFIGYVWDIYGIPMGYVIIRYPLNIY
jgi:hypothetical protein